jgi:hypothetical protein
VHDQPESTPEEQEQPPERQAEEDAMRQAGHDNPDRQREPAEDGDEQDRS